MHLICTYIYIYSFCIKSRIQSDTVVDGEAQNFKLNLDTEDLSKAAVGADDLNLESGY